MFDRKALTNISSMFMSLQFNKLEVSTYKSNTDTHKQDIHPSTNMRLKCLLKLNAIPSRKITLIEMMEEEP